MNPFDSFPDAIIKRADEGICVGHAISDYPYLRFTVWNDRMVDITGYTLEEINRLGCYQTACADPDVRARAAERISRMFRGDDLITEEWEITRSDGQKRFLRVSTSLLGSVNGFTHVLALVYDITERREAETALRRRDAILEAVTFSAGQVLRAFPGELVISEVLARLGEATEVSRIYIFENHVEADGNLATSQRHEWCAPGVNPQIDNAALQSFPLRDRGFGRWIELLQRRDLIQGLVREFPPEERSVLEAQDIRSVIVAPIFVRNEWWGFIGLDECSRERKWTALERSALMMGADMLGAAFQHRQAQLDLEKIHSELDTRPKERTSDLMLPQRTLEQEVEERKRAEESLTQRNQELTTISRVITATTTQIDWRTILNRILQGAIEITGLEGGTLCLVDHPHGCLELASAINTSEEMLRDLLSKDVRIGECLCGMVAKTGDPLILWDNASGSEFATREVLRREGIRFHAAFPLIAKGRCIGVLCVFARSDQKPDQRKLDLLQDLCGPIGLFLDNARLYEEEHKIRERVTHILESITDGFIAIDVEGRFIYINQKAKELFSLSAQELTGKALWSQLPQQVGYQLRAACEEAMAGRRPVRLEEYYPEWRRWFDTRIYPFQEGLAFYLNDITERKRMEEALRESEEKYRNLMEQSLQGTFVIQDMRIVFCNQAFLKMAGYAMGELYSFSPEELMNLIHPDDQKRVWDRYRQRLEGKPLPLTNNELRAVRKDGSIAWVEYDAVRIHYSGKPALLISLVDITKRREAERAMRESEQRYRQLAESAQEFIFIIDREGKVQYVNSSAAKEFGCHPEQLQGKSVMDLFPPNMGARHWDHIRKVIQSGQGLANSETRVIFPGREAWLNTSLVPLGTESGGLTQVLGISRDVTEFKQAEEALRESEKRYRELSEANARLLEQARQDAQTKTILLHEVNHRVKNNLASIIGLIQTQERFGKRKDSPAFRSMCRDLAGRVQGLATVHNLLSAAGWSSVKLDDLATEVIRSTVQILPPHHRVSVQVSPSSIRVSPDQANTLSLVINELATNTIKHGQREKQASSISVYIEEHDGQVLFEFRDNGPGYPEPINEERYNLGLYLITNLVRRDLRGEVTLRSDRGAVTRIEFEHRRS